MAVALLGVSVITFVIGDLLPGDPARVIAGPQASQAVVRSIRHQLGLDQAVYVQYWRFLGRAVRGDFGLSFRTQLEVLPTIWARFPYTVAVGVGGLLAEILVGVSLGIISAVRRGTVLDGIVICTALLGLSIPSFWLGLILLYVFGYLWPIVPLGGTSGWTWIILPSITLGFSGSAFYTRMTRTAMLETLSEDYVRTARAKGLPGRTIVLKHAFRNAIRTVVTMAGMDVGAFLGGVLVIEQVFGIPGIGALAWQAILNEDLPMIQGTVLFAASLIIVSNFAIDLMYGWIDPRIRTAS
ncbi:MAG: glutathione transporter permease GsiC [Chloroflexi bacterium]|nr:glutathione transporter permease GsiC [Chloroflexota bacterium]